MDPMGIYILLKISMYHCCVYDYMIILGFMTHTFGSEWCYTSNFRPCNHDLDELLLVNFVGHSAID